MMSELAHLILSIMEPHANTKKANHASLRRGQPALLHQLLDSVRLAKVHLTTQTETVIHIPSSKNLRGSNGFTLNITRKEMEEVTQSLRMKLAPPLAKLAQDCHIDWIARCALQAHMYTTWA